MSTGPTDRDPKGELDRLEEKLIAGFGLAMGVEPSDDLRNYVRTGSGGPLEAGLLLAWDANSIHDFVFDTANASAIRGGSEILQSIDKMLFSGEPLGVDRSQILYAGGGSGLAVVSDGQSGPALEALHRIFVEKTIVATCSAAAVPLNPTSERFDARVAAAEAAIQLSRARLCPSAEPSVPFFAARCAVCGRRAASRRQNRGPTQSERLECQPCHRRVEAGKADSRYKQEPSSYEEIFGDERHYALLYLDGNGVGRTLRKLPSPLAFADFSRSLASVVREAFEIVADRRNLGERHQLPICAGDDLVAVLPGRGSVQFAVELLTELERLADTEASLTQNGGRLGAAAGLAIASISFPIRHLIVETQALLRTAKQRVYRDVVRDAVNIAVVKDGSPRADSLDPERFQPLIRRGYLLSGFPYTLAEMHMLASRLKAIRDAKTGRTQFHSLRRSAASGPGLLRNQILYQVGRRPEWVELVKALAGTSTVPDADGCYEQFVLDFGGQRVFDLGDILDIAEFWVDEGRLLE